MSETTSDISSSKTKSTSSKTTFALGLVSGIAIVSLIGFSILLIKGETNSQKTETEQPTVQAPQPEEKREVLIAEVTKNDHIRGSLTAPVKIVEYSDLECPFCKRHHATMKQIVTEYGDKVAWVYRHLPLDSLHTKTRKEAQATECAADLGGNEKFWALTDKIYETTTSNDGLDLAGLPDLAAGVGLNKTKFKECLDSDKYKDKIQAQYEEANKAGIRGAPYNVIIGPDGKKTILPGAYPFESFKNAIDAMLKK